MASHPPMLPLDGSDAPLHIGKRRDGLAEVWPSSIVGLITGSATCGYEPWVKANYSRYEKTPSTFDFAKWRMEHTALMETTVARLVADGWACQVEDQNRFKLVGSSSILVGKPDIVARKGARVKVIDCKSGRQKDEHTVQVCIYVVALPIVWERKGLVIDGEVVYQDHSIDIDQAQADHFRQPLFAAMRRMGSDHQPTVPSEGSCRFCDVAGCADRFASKNEVAMVSTELF